MLPPANTVTSNITLQARHTGSVLCRHHYALRPNTAYQRHSYYFASLQPTGNTLLKHGPHEALQPLLAKAKALDWQPACCMMSYMVLATLPDIYTRSVQKAASSTSRYPDTHTNKWCPVRWQFQLLGRRWTLPSQSLWNLRNKGNQRGYHFFFTSRFQGFIELLAPGG